jgi:hypothetical protein
MEYRVESMASVTLQCRIGHAFFPGFVLALAALGCGSDGDGGGAAAGSGGSGPVATAGTGGVGGSAGNTGAAGTGGGGTGGTASSSGNTEGTPDVSGRAGAPAVAGSGGGGSETPSEPEPPEVTDERPWFSFFVTSQAGLFALPAGENAPAPDPEDGYGGNLGGLAGADEICTMLARASNPTDQKTWRAFLSTAGVGGGERVDAIDRVGPGPWFDYNGLLLAETVEGLLPEGNDGRPSDADPQLADMFTDENGEDVRPSQQIDNHDTLTGSGQDGRLFDDGAGGSIATCEDWTSSTVRGNQGNMMGFGGQVPVGHSWPRTNNNGRHWIQEHTINGCEPGADIDGGAGAPAGDFRVGAGGGYGGFYCFALGAVAPETP